MKKLIQSLVSRGLSLVLVLGLVGVVNAQAFDGNGALEGFYVQPRHDHHVRNRVLTIVAVAGVAILAGTLVAHERGGNRGFTTGFAPQAPFAPPAPSAPQAPGIPSFSGTTLISCVANGSCTTSGHN